MSPRVCAVEGLLDGAADTLDMAVASATGSWVQNLTGAKGNGIAGFSVQTLRADRLEATFGKYTLVLGREEEEKEGERWGTFVYTRYSPDNDESMVF